MQAGQAERGALHIAVRREHLGRGTLLDDIYPKN
jgi:hypothetical protein